MVVQFNGKYILLGWIFLKSSSDFRYVKGFAFVFIRWIIFQGCLC